MKYYYFVRGERIIVVCPNCGTQISIPRDVFNQIDAERITPKRSFRCPTCASFSVKVGDELVFSPEAQAQETHSGQSNSYTGRQSYTPSGTAATIDTNHILYDTLLALKNVDNHISELTNLTADSINVTVDVNKKLTLVSDDINSIRKWVKFFGVLVVIALIIALSPIILAFFGVTCSIYDRLK